MKQEEPMNPLISVIVPVYNVSPYLREALDSLIHQTWKNLEILLVDDGSTDGSGEICDEYARDPRVRVFHQENRGLSGARNTGLDHMTGEYVAFLDPDDAFHPETIEKLFLALSENDADLSACGFEVFETEGLLKEGKRKGGFSFGGERVLTRPEAILAMAEEAFPVAAWNKLYRRSLWDDFRYPERRIFEDIRTAPQILNRCDRIAVVPETLVYYRRRKNSITSTCTAENTHEAVAAFKAAQEYLEQAQPELPSEILRKNLERLLRAMIFRWGEFRVRGAAWEDAQAIREEILEFANGKTRFTDLRTRVVWGMFLHCPSMLVPAHECFLIYLKTAGLFRGPASGWRN